MRSRIGNFVAGDLQGHIDWGRYDWAFVESPWQTTLFDLRGGAPGENPQKEVARAVRAVLFSAACEMRWLKKRDGKFHCVAIEDGEPSAGQSDAVLDWKPLSRLEDRRYVLWGEPDGETWWESRIPREIREYPKELQGKRVCMVVREYEFEPPSPAADGGQVEPPVVLMRLVGFEEALLS